MSASRRKQEDQNLKVLKSIQQQESNRRCFECDQRGPTYVDVTVGSFVCTSCGGILRGINPPHRVKSVSMATFTAAEIDMIQKRGNEYCTNVYLGKYDERSKAKPESRSDVQKLRSFMEEKYEKKRWYVSPEQVEKNKEKKPDVAKAPVTAVLPKPHANVVAKPLQAPPQQAAATQKPTVDNILGDFANFDLNIPSQQANVAAAPNDGGGGGGFADFSSAFSQPSTKVSPFDAFGDFNSMQAPVPQQQQQQSTPAGFQNSFQLLPSTNSHGAAPPQPPPAPAAVKPVDKYADLGDLFSLEIKPEPVQSTNKPSWGSVFTTPSATDSSSLNNASSVFSMPQGSIFQSQSASFATSNSSTTNQTFDSFAQKPLDNKNMMIPNQNHTQNMSPFGNSPSNQHMFGNINQQQQQQQQQQPAGYGYVAGNNGMMTAPQNQQQMFASNNFAVQTQSVPSTMTAFGTAAPHNAFAAGGAPQQGFVGQQQQQQSASPFMTANTQANPFFQPQTTGIAPVAAPPSSNPFMSANSWSNNLATAAPTNAGPPPQVSATNPFMTNQQAMQPQKTSTNPFF